MAILNSLKLLLGEGGFLRGESRREANAILLVDLLLEFPHADLFCGRVLVQFIRVQYLVLGRTQLLLQGSSGLVLLGEGVI